MKKKKINGCGLRGEPGELGHSKSGEFWRRSQGNWRPRLFITLGLSSTHTSVPMPRMGTTQVFTADKGISARPRPKTVIGAAERVSRGLPRLPTMADAKGSYMRCTTTNVHTTTRTNRDFRPYLTPNTHPLFIHTHLQTIQYQLAQHRCNGCQEGKLFSAALPLRHSTQAHPWL